ncbi:MAG: hypothetical protein KDB07_03185 [Planctomycetes bacterium]|nr:hypothetical protein [Planctomycetota bacterium]
MQHPEFEKGMIPQDADLRWVAEVRDFMRRATMATVGTELEILVNTKGEISAFLRLHDRVTQAIKTAIRDTVRLWAKESNTHRLHAVIIDDKAGFIRIVLYKKREKKFGRKR